MKNWKTTLLGILGGLALMFGPRLSGDKTAPPITTSSFIQGALVAALGAVSKDHNVTGGTVEQ